MKRILVLLGRYYPNASPNSVCVKNIINCLPQDKYSVDIVSYDDGTSVVNENNVRVNRGLLQSLIYKYESSNKTIIMKILQFVLRIKTISCFLIWPWTDPIVTLKIKNKVNQLLKYQEYDYVLAVYMPLSSLIVANYVKQHHKSIKYIAYFLDSLSGGYLPNLLNNERYENKLVKWEKRLIRNADNIVFMKSSESFHRQLYRNTEFESRITYLDLPMLVEREALQTYKSTTKVLLYVGSLAASIRSPEYILKVFSLIDDPDLEFQFVGDSASEILNEYAKEDKRIKVIGKCAHEEALAYEKKADILINLGNKNPNLAPSKVFEYLSFGKKIVSTYSIDSDTSIQYLQKYNKALLLDERNEDFVSVSNVLAKFIYQNEEEIHFEDIASMYWDNTPQAFAALLDE